MRIFFAIGLPVAHKELITAYQDSLRQGLEQHYKSQHFHWVRPENFHVTLQFLGEVREKDLTLILAEVAAALHSEKSFSLTFGRPEWFPNPNRPRVLSLQVGPSLVLAKISGLMGEGIKACGYPIETRSYRGHLTLGRVDELKHLEASLLESFALPPLEPFLVQSLVCYRSEPERGKAVYTPLAGIPLKNT